VQKMACRALVALVLFFSQTCASWANETMQAAGLNSPDYNQSVVKVGLMRLPKPRPQQGQVLIKVMSSSVNHLDLLWEVINPPLMWKAFVASWQAQGAFPKVLGLDVAGIVTAVGPDVSRLHVGDQVWAFNAANCVYDGRTFAGLAGHTWAEYVAIDADQVSLKPSSMNFQEAGALPLDALTALGALKLAGAPWRTGGAVLILGATGGVGHFAVQLARALGARKVIATASKLHQTFVKSLGVDHFIDYHTSNWWNSSVVPDGSLVAVVDTVLQPLTGDRAFSKLEKYGRFVSLCQSIPVCGAPMASTATQLEHLTISQHALRCTSGSCAGASQLDELRHYVDVGKLKIHLEKIVPLTSIIDAVAELEGGHTVGKVGITVNNCSEMLLV